MTPVETVEGRRATQQRLRQLIRGIESWPLPRRAVAPAPPSLASLLPDVRDRETAAGVCAYREVRYPLDHEVGEQPLAELRHARAAALGVLAPQEGLEDAEARDLLFLDIETTGLGGAGVMAFLVATGRLEDGEFVLRQYVARSPEEEAALLDALLEDVAMGERDPVLATYNGRAFDAPMLDERATMHRRRAGFDSLRQLDLLLPARTAYRGLLESCRLAVVEAEVLGLTRHDEDVPGAEVPAWYFRYLRSGDARCLVPLISHNEVDVVALAALTARLAAIVSGARDVGGIEALATGRVFSRRREVERARSHLERAVHDLLPSAARDEAVMRLAMLHKSVGRRDLAEPLWHELASRADAGSLRPHVELAMYYEHHTRDLDRASTLVEGALAVVERALARWDERSAERWRGALLHRQARIERKVERRALAAQ